MELDRTTVKKILFIIGVTVVFILCAVYIEEIFGFIRKFIKVISPLLLGAFMAFVTNLVLRPVEKFWEYVWRKKKSGIFKKLKRPVCLVISMAVVLGLIFSLLVYIIPAVIKTFGELLESIPRYIKNVPVWAEDLLNGFEKISVVFPSANFDASVMIEKLLGFLKNSGVAVLTKTLSVTTSVFTLIFNCVVGIVLSIYILAKKEALTYQSKRVLRAFIPSKHIEDVFGFISRVSTTFTNFIAGQFLEAIIIGVLCFLGMTIFKMPYAPLTAVIIGITALIPVFGAFIGIAIGAVLCLSKSFMTAVWFAVFMIILQQLEGNLIYPNVVGKSVGLPGIWVLIAVTIGGGMFGIMGMLISVPVCSILYFTLHEMVDERLNKGVKK